MRTISSAISTSRSFSGCGIRLEAHGQLGTDSKIFTAASTAFGDDPNTQVDPVVFGHLWRGSSRGGWGWLLG